MTSMQRDTALILCQRWFSKTTLCTLLINIVFILWSYREKLYEHLVLFLCQLSDCPWCGKKRSVAINEHLQVIFFQKFVNAVSIWSLCSVHSPAFPCWYSPTWNTPRSIIFMAVSTSHLPLSPSFPTFHPDFAFNCSSFFNCVCLMPMVASRFDGG